MIESRKCTKCGNIYPLTKEFWHKSSRGKLGFKSQCKECRNSYNREYIKEYHKKHTERMDKHNRHIWVNRRKKAPRLCVMCNKEKKLELANLSDNYYRDIRDFIWVCRDCHLLLDKIYKQGRLKQE